MTPSLETLNLAPDSKAMELMEPLVECSPWVARAALHARPFASHEDIAEALVKIILSSGHSRQRDLFNAHADLAGTAADGTEMSDASVTEQSGFGLMRLAREEAQRLKDLNSAYRVRFGFPFIIALHRVCDRPALFETFERRLTASPIEEHTQALAEIASVISSRCRRLFSFPSNPTHATTAEPLEI